MNAPAPPALAVEGLDVRIDGDGGSFLVVRDMAFAVARGETLAIVGESGCGKSMTALSLMRLQPPAATIVRGADTARLHLAPECAGLLAASLGLSRMHRDDLAQLDAGMALYDAFYRWARDATEETHNWPAGKPA